MLSALFTDEGSDSSVIFTEQAMPVCQPTQLLVRVSATALNRADLMQRLGKYPPPPGESAIPGLELAGEVVAIGDKVSRFKPGDNVYALTGSGAYAQYCCVDEYLAEKIPDDWDFLTAAALPEALTTTNAVLFELGHLSAGQTLLIHAAGSGISTMAFQMATLSGATSISTASNSEKIAKALDLGVSSVVNYKTQDFSDVLPENSIDLIVDFIGGTHFIKHLRLLKTKGHLVQISALQGRMVECDLGLLMKKRLQINGFVLRPQSLDEKRLLWQAAQQRWSKAIANNQLKPIIDSVFDFNKLNEAHQYMLAGKHYGKIVIKIS